MTKPFIYLCLLSITLMGCNATKKTMAKDEMKNETIVSALTLPPLIDREIFFGNAEISSGELSPDGNRVAFLKEYEGIMNVWVKDFDESFDDARLLTKSKSPILGFFWTIDGKYLLYINDKDGDENMNIFAVDPSQATKDKLPPSRNLTPLDEVTAQIYMVSRKDPNVMMVGINDRDKAWHDLYKLEIKEGKLTKLFENKDRITGWDFDWDEKARLAYRTDEDGISEILRIEEDGRFVKIYDTNLQESAYVAGWNEDNSKCYLISNKGDVNFTGLYLMDPTDGSTTLIEQDPLGKVDFGGMFMDRNTRKIVFTSYTDDKTRLYWKDKAFEADYNFLKQKFPGREISITSLTKDYNKWLVAFHGDRYASDVYFFDRKSKELIHQYTPKPRLKEVEEHLVEMKPVSYPSSDGLKIPGYLSLPKGKKAKGLPVVVLVHGGPKGPRDRWGYNAFVQFLTNRGYAVLQPNFRASGGYGKAFLNAGDRQWGKLMQDDITWGVKYLIDKGIADPKRVAIMGGSYGGYATLAGLAFTPDLYACGVDIVGPSNLFTLLESVPPYWEAFRKHLYEMVGDPDTEEGQKLLREASPLFSADKIKAPLMIIQGANDPRVKKAESDQIVIALRDKGQPVSYLLAEDEGHGFRKPLNRKAMMADIERFLAQHINGRYQVDMPEDVRKTLEKLRVDVSTVRYTPVEKVESLGEMPEIKVDINTGTYNYRLTVEVQGQTINMDKKRSVEKIDGGWKISESSNGPMGEMADEMNYTADFKPLKRIIKQGGMTMPVQYDGQKVSAEMMGKKMDIKADGALLPDGPGQDYIIHALGLKNGEEMSFYVADMMMGKANQVKLTKQGQEELNGKTVDYYTIVQVENTSAKTEIYIDPSKGMALKTVRVIPAMGNAKLTEELVE